MCFFCFYGRLPIYTKPIPITKKTASQLNMQFFKQTATRCREPLLIRFSKNTLLVEPIKSIQHKPSLQKPCPHPVTTNNVFIRLHQSSQIYKLQYGFPSPSNHHPADAHVTLHTTDAQQAATKLWRSAPRSAHGVVISSNLHS